MAVDEARRGEGIGTAVLDAVVGHVAARGGGLLWCSARTPAVGFYRRADFAVRGEPWVDPVLGPHVAMHRMVAAPERKP
jgi:GNAT superfamily N-acetyltransferase